MQFRLLFPFELQINGLRVLYRVEWLKTGDSGYKREYANRRPTPTFFTSILPPLEIPFGSSSEPYESTEHETAALQIRTFSILKEFPEVKTTLPTIWSFLKSRPAFPWGSESDIQVLVKIVVEDAISAPGLEKEVRCMNELGISNLHPDIWIIISEGIPIGVVEVKKPGKNIMQSERVHVQI